MRSKAAVGKHPIHPALVSIPIGAFALTFIADLCRIMGLSPDWGTTARHALVIGVLTALLAALFGFLDYLFVDMSKDAKKLATYHLVMNLGALALFVVSFLLRQSASTGWSTGAFLVSTFAFLVLGASGWIGGELVFRHKVGVVEGDDPQATAIGQREDRQVRERAPGGGVEYVPEARKP